MYLKLNLKKLFTYKKKALFLIIPVTILLALGIIVSSEARNILTAAEQSIFGTIAEQSRLIVLSKDQFSMAGGPGGGGKAVTFRLDSTDSSDEYKQADLDKIKSITGVESAQILSNLPVSNVIAKDLFSDKQFNIGSLAGIDSNLAAQYTGEDFTYTEGEAIPIVLNSRNFIEQYQDWKDKTEISIDFSTQRPGQGMKIEDSPFPIKSRTIDYNKNDVIGKEFTATVGGLDPLQDYKQEPTDTGIKFVKLTQAEIDTQEAARKNALSPYWNYDQIKTPLIYKFKVVGIIESDSQFSSFIPTNFADKLMKDYISNQVNARTASAIPTSDLNSKFQGITFDGLELKQDPFAQFRALSGGGVAGGRAIRIFGGPGGASSIADSDSTSYEIPGLVIETDRAGSTVKGEYKSVDVYTNTPRSGSTLLIRTDSVYSRADVVKQLNAGGYAYQDLSKANVINELKSSLNTVVIVMTVLIVSLSVVVIIFTMGKFVSESKREIGIFRALGASKGQVKLLFMTQALVYVFIGYVLGAVIGLLGVIASASIAHAWFDGFIAKTLKEAFSVVNPVNGSVFTGVNWEMLAAYSVGLLILSIAISLIPATNASNMSPVEAIKGE